MGRSLAMVRRDGGQLSGILPADDADNADKDPDPWKVICVICGKSLNGLASGVMTSRLIYHLAASSILHPASSIELVYGSLSKFGAMPTTG